MLKPRIPTQTWVPVLDSSVCIRRPGGSGGGLSRIGVSAEGAVVVEGHEEDGEGADGEGDDDEDDDQVRVHRLLPPLPPIVRTLQPSRIFLN